MCSPANGATVTSPVNFVAQATPASGQTISAMYVYLDDVVVYKALNIWLISQTDLSKLVLGGFIVLIVVVFPKGIVGMLEMLAQRRKSTSPPGAALLAKPIESAE